MACLALLSPMLVEADMTADAATLPSAAPMPPNGNCWMFRAFRMPVGDPRICSHAESLSTELLLKSSIAEATAVFVAPVHTL